MATMRCSLVVFLVTYLYHSSGANYVGIPQSNATIRVALKQKLELTCRYTDSNGTGEFLGWYKDDLLIDGDKPERYEVRKTDKEMTLIIKVFVQADSEVNRWFIKTSKEDYKEPRSCQFKQIIIKSSPQGMESNRPSEKIDSSTGSIKRYLDEEVSVKCLIEPNRTDRLLRTKEKIQWSFIKDNQTAERLPEGVRLRNDDELVIKQVKISHRGSYRCTLNDVSFSVFLRVKDPWTALWPFLGIVSVVLTLIVIILIYEKRQKSLRQAAAGEDEETDHVNDPLVRSTENESRKRVVKA